MLVIGIDPGTASTGYGLVSQDSGGDLSETEFGLISTAAGRPMQTRLLDLYESLRKILAIHKPDEAAVEKIFFQRNVSSAISVGQARGVVLLALAQAGLPVFAYNPREIKMAICGYGNAGKRQMQGMVKALLKMNEIPRPDDAADALAVAICHIHSSKMRKLGEEV
jgi:crossover junction endodeoxyribonuclease RuvC